MTRTTGAVGISGNSSDGVEWFRSEAMSRAKLAGQGLLSPGGQALLGRLAAAAGETRERVLLAAALAVRSVESGSTCVDLATVRAIPTADPAGAMVLPPDRAGWRDEVAGSGLTGDESSHPERPFTLRGSLLYPTFLARTERAVAETIRTLASEASLDRLDAASLDAICGAGMDDAQRAAVDASIARRFSVITGGPGTGKTYTLRAVLAARWLAARRAGRTLRVKLAAPTGKAAQRMQESVGNGLQAWLDGMRGPLPEEEVNALGEVLREVGGQTIHRLLRWSAGRFVAGPESPVDADLIVVDEASMLSVELLRALLDALGDGAALVLLGDRNQLASVDAGTVMADLCLVAGIGEGAEVGILSPNVRELTKMRRFEETSGIGRFARACVSSPFDPAGALRALDSSPDVEWIPLAPDAPLGRDALGRIVDVWEAVLRETVRRPDLDPMPLARERLAALHRVRVLAAHRDGPTGVAGLNAAIRSELAARGVVAGGNADTWDGRPLLVTRNDYAVDRFNGDVGVVGPGPAPQGGLAAWFEDGDRDPVSMALSSVPPHETAYAMTVHRSQGSEFDHVVLVLPSRVTAVLTRELLYTAVTRAKKRLTIVGAPGVLREALGRRAERASGLAGRLHG